MDELIETSEATQEQNTKNNKVAAWIYDLVSILITALIAITIIFTLVFRLVGVVGPSMESTLYNGEWLYVTAFTRSVKYGDIVIITQPNSFNEPIVKRVIATQGQEVDIDFETGIVKVDGNILSEDYIQGKTTSSFDVEFPVKVPSGCVFVMGDNRNHSIDSRSSDIGFIDNNYILGTVKYKIIPFGKVE